MKDRFFKYIFFAISCVAVLCVALICLFIFCGGLPSILKIGVFQFVFGRKWKPEIEVFGIFPMIMASLVATFGALVLAVPIGVFCAVFLARFCPSKKLKMCLVSLIDLLSALPSVVIGFFGLMVIVPFIRNMAGGSGSSLLSAILVLFLMILPTIISITQSAVEQLPYSYLQGSLALGATKEHSVFFVELRACSSALSTGIVLALGRAIGETMAVIMVAGNQPIMIRSLFKGARTLTANIALEMGYAAGLHRGALIGTSTVLFIFILFLNIVLLFIQKKEILINPKGD